MKKLSALLFAALFFTSSAFAEGAGEIVLKGGAGIFGWMSDPKIEVSGPGAISGAVSMPESMLKGKSGGKSLSIGAEYLYPVIDIVKIGAGFQYVSISGAKIKIDTAPLGAEFSMDASLDSETLPVYATLQIAPFKENNIKPIYIKANFGYSVYQENNSIMKSMAEMMTSGSDMKINIESKGGIYWGIAAGYEFSNGIIVEAGYESFSGSTKWEMKNLTDPEYSITTEFKSAYNQFGLKIGYRIAL